MRVGSGIETMIVIGMQVRVDETRTGGGSMAVGEIAGGIAAETVGGKAGGTAGGRVGAKVIVGEGTNSYSFLTFDLAPHANSPAES